jgi:phage baseplate assembly protein W
MNTFIGFSTIAPASGRRTWVLNDVELIKRDLLNHFYTRRGERVMRPTFGSILPELVMEPNTQLVREQIETEVTRIINMDSRLGIKNIQTRYGKNTVAVISELMIIPLKTVTQFIIEFDTRQGEI